MNAQINDGGPAFPTSYRDCGHSGMSLRDWFAGQALAGIMANADYAKHINHEHHHWRISNAAHAYDAADAMLGMREKGQTK